MLEGTTQGGCLLLIDLLITVYIHGSHTHTKQRNKQIKMEMGTMEGVFPKRVSWWSAKHKFCLNAPRDDQRTSLCKTKTRC